jgi:hypothetical protein
VEWRPRPPRTLSRRGRMNSAAGELLKRAINSAALPGLECRCRTVVRADKCHLTGNPEYIRSLAEFGDFLVSPQRTHAE